MTEVGPILGTWRMRRGDRLPLLALAVETDDGESVDLTGAHAFLLLRCHDGMHPLTPLGEAPAPNPDGSSWLVLEAAILDPTAGIVVYDWPEVETANLTVGIDELAIGVQFADGTWITAPSDRHARLVVRPSVIT